MWEQNKGFILYFFAIIFAVFGAFCFGIWLMSPLAH